MTRQLAVQSALVRLTRYQGQAVFSAFCQAFRCPQIQIPHLGCAAVALHTLRGQKGRNVFGKRHLSERCHRSHNQQTERLQQGAQIQYLIWIIYEIEPQRDAILLFFLRSCRGKGGAAVRVHCQYGATHLDGLAFQEHTVPTVRTPRLLAMIAVVPLLKYPIRRSIGFVAELLLFDGGDGVHREAGLDCGDSVGRDDGYG